MARHGSERQSQAIVAALGGSVRDAALQTSGIPEVSRQLLSGAYGTGAKVGVLLPYHRRPESEADRLGLIYMARAGYDPKSALTIWRKLAAYSKRQGADMTLSILRTHPVDEQRIANIQKDLPEAVANRPADS